ncbi:helix-turn-helix domain-containing protein [Kaistia sp. MMO-174]|uniref:helix-turn-helix domain-containing protein n=1 Tax=Kaistia sp. MMO-174 TaxID=3081256 RepID=UPI003015D023
MNKQIITTPGGERLVVIPEAEFDAMREAIEDAQDAAAVVEYRRKLAAGEEEQIPSAIVDRILAGENKVRVWRDHRGISARELAVKAALSTAYLSQIETGARAGTIDVMKRIAEALGVTLDELA